MNLEDLAKVMIERGLVIRAIPKEKTFGVPVQNVGRYSDKNKYTIGEVFKPDNLDKELVRITERFSQGGKFIVASKMNQDSTVSGAEWYRGADRKVTFFDTIEQAIEAILT